MAIELPSIHVRVQIFNDNYISYDFFYILLFHGDADFLILYIFNSDTDILGVGTHAAHIAHDGLRGGKNSSSWEPFPTLYIYPLSYSIINLNLNLVGLVGIGRFFLLRP